MTFDQIAIALLGGLALPGQRSEFAQMGASVRHAGAAVPVFVPAGRPSRGASLLCRLSMLARGPGAVGLLDLAAA